MRKSVEINGIFFFERKRVYIFKTAINICTILFSAIVFFIPVHDIIRYKSFSSARSFVVNWWFFSMSRTMTALMFPADEGTGRVDFFGALTSWTGFRRTKLHHDKTSPDTLREKKAWIYFFRSQTSRLNMPFVSEF